MICGVDGIQSKGCSMFIKSMVLWFGSAGICHNRSIANGSAGIYRNRSIANGSAGIYHNRIIANGSAGV